MSADKLQAVHEALADAFNERNVNATGREISHPAFDHGTLSEAFSELHLNAANTEQSFARLDHAALTGIFSEPVRISPAEEPSPTSFDRALAEILSEHPPLSSNTQPSQPDFDQQAFSEILRKPPPISNNTKPTQPSFDHQALAEMLTEARADPINPQIAPLSFDVESSSAAFSGQIDHEEPMAKAFAVAQSTNPESAQPPRAKSLLAKLHHIFSNKEEPPLSNVEKDSLPPSLSGQLHTPEPTANVISTIAEDKKPRPANLLLAELLSLRFEHEPKSPHLSGQPGNARLAVSDVAAPSPTEDAVAWPPQATSLQTDISSPISNNTESSPPVFEGESSTPTVSDRLKNMASTASTAAPSAPTNVESAQPQRLRWLLAELGPMVSANQKTPLATSEKEPSRPISSTRLNNSEAMARTASVAPQANSENAVMQPLEAKRLASETLPPVSTDTEPQAFIFGNESSPISLSDQPDHAEPAARIAATVPLPAAEDARPQLGKSLLAEQPPSRLFLKRTPSPVTLSGEPDNVGPAVETIAATSPAHAVTAQQQTKSLPLTDLPALISTNTKSSSPTFEQGSRAPSLSGQPDIVGPSAKSVVAADPAEAEGDLRQHVNPLLAARRVLNAKPSPPVVENEPSRSTLASQPDNGRMSVKTIVVAHPTDAEGALSRQAQSSPAEMPALISSDAKLSAPIFEKERPPAFDQPAKVAPTAEAAAVASPGDMESAVTRAQQAKALLDGLDLNTAIHLRWVMRDIRSKRTKFSPVGANDLAALTDLGLVEMREGLPRLTGLGILALD